ncbi:MAG: hypothetical protein HYR60_15135 [Acidobacteria bacterium]|nr:hypothetical protein [Acidobacteriota bacterium]MBI3472049.1 hypothetical protein [Candidatus Solibacter usitatus]
MIRHPLYLLYGALLLGVSGMAGYRGWSSLKVDEVKNVPKTVRDNPGAYRSHYGYYSRYIGGK